MTLYSLERPGSSRSLWKSLFIYVFIYLFIHSFILASYNVAFNASEYKASEGTFSQGEESACSPIYGTIPQHLQGRVQQTPRTSSDTMSVLRAGILIRTFGIRRRIANSGEAFTFSANEERPIQTKGTLFTT